MVVTNINGSALDRLTNLVASKTGMAPEVQGGSALDRLAAMINLAEARSQGDKLIVDIGIASERVRVASENLNAMRTRLDKDRPVLEQAIKQVEKDRATVKEQIRTLARLRVTMDEPTRAEADDLIAETNAEIDVRETEHKLALETLLRDSSAVRKEFNEATADYQRIRAEIDRLKISVANINNMDELVAQANETSISRSIIDLTKEILDVSPHFQQITRTEQFLQLKIWIGRFRQLQDQFESQDQEDQKMEERQSLRSVFPMLVDLSKTYQPGYIEAFQQHYTTDWSAFIADAQEEMRKLHDERAEQRR